MENALQPATIRSIADTIIERWRTMMMWSLLYCCYCCINANELVMRIGVREKEEKIFVGYETES